MPSLQRVRILYVEDDEEDYVLACEYLNDVRRDEYSFDWAPTFEKGWKEIDKRDHDVYLIDFRLGQHSGLELITKSRASGVTKPMILLTGRGDRDIDVAAMDAGADDYLSKMDLDGAVLERAIRYSIKQHTVTHRMLESEQRLHDYVETATDWIWEIDQNLRFIRTPGGLLSQQSLLPYEKMLGKKTWELEGIESDTAKWVAHRTDLDERRLFQNFEFEMRPPGGGKRTIQISGKPIFATNGTFKGYRGTGRDITESREIEERLFRSQKMEAIGQLTGGIAHDFNNMLSAITGFAELLKHKIQDQNDEKASHYIDRIINSGERASTLISQMLAFSRGESVESQPIDLLQSAHETVRMMSSTIPSSIQISLDSTADVPLIEADETQLSQILMNICINARDAFGGVQGQIEITVGHRSNWRGACSSCYEAVSGEYVALSVKDNAGGIPADIRASMFNPFFTTKAVGEGTGMGLAMVHGIVHGFGGHITVDVDEGVGTTFHLLFPAAPKQAKSGSVENAVQPEAARLPMDGIRVLVVDDEPALVELLQEVLEDEGCLVSPNTDSRAAGNLLKSQLDRFDIMITDQTMPGLSGADLVRIARGLDPEFPVILCSGYSPQMNPETASLLGINRYFTKPIHISEVVQAVGEILGTAPSR